MTALPSIADWLKNSVQPDEFNPRDPKLTGTVSEIIVRADKIRSVAREFLARQFFLENMTAVDFAECFEIAYHFNRWDKSERYAVKLVVDKTQNEAPSLTAVYKSANWFEREIFDMFGIRFADHPNLKRILLPESSTIHPLLKSFKGEPKGADLEQSLKLIQEDKAGFEIQYPHSITRNQKDYYLNLGPQHPSTHGVLRVLLHLSGERVIDAEPIIGYSHRHHEKMMEIQNYLACWPNFGRLDYVGAMAYNFGYALLVERAMGVTPPPRVEYIRVLTTELNHIASHLLWLGTFAMDLGAFTPFFYCFDEREKILDLLESATGERLTYDYYRFGGVDHDVDDDMLKGTRLFMDSFKKKLKDLEVLVGKNIIFQQRTKGLGVLSREDALSYGLTGPMLRALGVPMDLRRTEPYSIYPQLDFDIPVQNDGDVYSRFLVRFQEIKESLKIITQVLDKFPSGEYKSGKLPKNVPKGEYFSAVESARGTFGIHLISDGTLNPYRMKLRTPSFSNLSAFGDMVPGCLVSDVVAVLGSTDIVLPEIDR